MTVFGQGAPQMPTTGNDNSVFRAHLARLFRDTIGRSPKPDEVAPWQDYFQKRMGGDMGRMPELKAIMMQHAKSQGR